MLTSCRFFHRQNTAIILPLILFQLCTALEPQIPSIKNFTSATSGDGFSLNSNVQIIVDSSYQTFGSPSLLDYAHTFRADLIDVTGFNDIPDVSVGTLPTAGPNVSPTVFLTLGTDGEKHTFFGGGRSGEGYDFQISIDAFIITGVEAIGVWWGTRTLLQQAILASSGSSIVISPGSGSDTPGWEIRGFMLDAGRHWFEPSFLADLCIYASFFKLQTLHIHASDNLWNPSFLYGKDWRNLYSSFRFRPSDGSPIAGLVPSPLRNETWTKEEFQAIQSTCSAHGITVVPEIDTPGHSLAISKWKPELMIAGAPDHLNLSHPDTIPTIKAIWDEVLPWFTASEVSIGADEYEASLADDYILFVNDMSAYVNEKSGKRIRVWGTNEPSDTVSISTDVTIQHWNLPGDSRPVELLRKGYRVINSEQQFLYLDGKTSDDGQFPVELDEARIWSGAPGGQSWAPNIFSRNDAASNVEIGHPLLRGSIMALWNDWGNNATTPLEIYYQLAKSLAMVSEKTWAGPEGLSLADFQRVYPILSRAAPGQNLDRTVSASGPNSDIVFQYDTVSPPLRTTFDSVGPPYTFTFSVKPANVTSISVPLFMGMSGPVPIPEPGGVIFSGRDSILHASSLSFEDPTTRKRYPLDYTLPFDSFTKVEIHATREYTYALINGSSRKWFWTTSLDIWGGYMKSANMSFAAPSAVLGGDYFFGELKDVSLRLGQ